MRERETEKVIAIGIGNEGRRDDGLGWRFLEYLEDSNKFKGEIEYRYQLQIEDAELISHYDKVIFVDASQAILDTGFRYSRLEKKRAETYTTHAVPPEHILYLCVSLYNKEPRTYLLEIEGKEWGLELGMSTKAWENLEKAKIAIGKELTSEVNI